MLRVILNVIWLVLCGLWMAIGYAVAGLLCFVLIITIPFGIAAFRIAGYVLWPFGRTIERRAHAGVGSMIGNVLWVILFGWWLTLEHRDHRRPARADDHRHSARHRQLQDHPDYPAAARDPYRAC